MWLRSIAYLWGKRLYPFFKAVHESRIGKQRLRSRKYNGVWDSIIWREIFKQIFGNYPQGNSEDPNGNQDKRWDCLFSKPKNAQSGCGALRQYLHYRRLVPKN